MPVVPDSLVHMLANVDDPRRQALVAEVNDGDRYHVVALGNVGGIDDDHAELGLVVADAWQRRGIGLALATEVLRAAEGRGYQRFVIQAFWDSPALRPFLSHLANVVARTTYRGVSEITFVLRKSAAVPSGAIRRPKTPADDLLEKAYERILAAKGGTSPY
jgi:GNAT superfamily N-acetyltransferase